jgi:hypothetical protein
VRRLFLPASIRSFAADLNSGQRDRARLKERDENVRFKQSMTPHVSREGRLAPWKLDANGNASRPIPNLVGFDCGFGSCGDLLQGEVMARRLIAPVDGRCGGTSWALPVQARPPRAAARQPGQKGRDYVFGSAPSLSEIIA